MRWFFAMLILAVAVPAQAQPNEAERLYAGFESKMLAAKAFKIAFDIEMSGKQVLTMKGQLTAAVGNKLKVFFEGTDAGKNPATGSLVSDGKQIARKSTALGKTEANSEPTPKEMTQYLTRFLTPVGVAVAVTSSTKPNAAFSPDKFKITGFKLGAKEKLGEREAQVVEYTMEGPDAKEGKASCKLWLDPKTSLPVKRYLELTAMDGKITQRILEQYATWQIDPPLKDDEFTLPK